LGIGAQVVLDANRLATLEPKLQVDVDQLHQQRQSFAALAAQVVLDRRRSAELPGLLERLDQPLAARPRRVAQQADLFGVVEPGSCHRSPASPGLLSGPQSFQVVADPLAQPANRTLGAAELLAYLL